MRKFSKKKGVKTRSNMSMESSVMNKICKIIIDLDEKKFYAKWLVNT